ncbi:MAG: endolytic transglycosylase MltG, partial [Firmicutes bacterium]|nr:endolytic transglycosylase MltG [Bacillota bacterium]
YQVPEGYEEEDIIDFLLGQFEQTVLPVYDSADQSLKDKYTLNEIITAASIIERECMKDDERPLVASVIYNRMDQNIKLEMCSTIQYLLLQETGQVKENLLYSDLEIESPYNTYLHFGLPPGPICSPGIASIKAALEPADTDYLYFVVSADLDGSSKFSSNYDDFLDYKDEYYEAWNAANSND